MAQSELVDPISTARPRRDRPPAPRKVLSVGAVALGERIDLRALRGERLTADSLSLNIQDGGTAVIFRYGCVVFFDVSESAQHRLLDELSRRVAECYPKREVESAELTFGDSPREGSVGELAIPNASSDTLQIVADVFGKSVALAHYESAIATAFDQIEPLAFDLERRGRADRRSAQLVRQIAQTLLAQHRLVGRVEVMEKPELLWERPELELLHLKLAEEYELKERELALERKLVLVSRTAEVLLNLLQDKRSLRVEWYILGLIVFEIVLSLYDMFLRAP